MLSENNDIKDLYSLILSLETDGDCADLFHDLCTEKELEQMAQRVKAARLLLETEMSVEAIISELGYENESFFRKAFKERYGKNPLEFRKRSVK